MTLVFQNEVTGQSPRDRTLVKRRQRLCCCLSLPILLSLGSTAYPQEPLEVVSPAQEDQPVIVTFNDNRQDNVPAEAQMLEPAFRVFVDLGPSCCDESTEVAGRYVQTEDELAFFPSFEFRRGITYRVVGLKACEELSEGRSDCEAQSEVWEHTFELTPPATEPPVVSAVFPSAHELPENTLRFYIYFSSPMTHGGQVDGIKLYDDSGQEVQTAFMQYKQELWSPDYRRLTVVFEPGRIKRGVGPNVSFGPALQAGSSYRLVINSQFEDANGVALGQSFEKMFHVVETDRTEVRPEEWQVYPPEGGSRQDLLVKFPAPLDHALVDRLIAVQTADGSIVPGQTTLHGGETEWFFSPRASWAPGDYYIRIDPNLEDVAGNNLLGPLDRQLDSAPPRGLGDSFHYISFSVAVPISTFEDPPQ